jgi:uncharacterized membrane protein
MDQPITSKQLADLAFRQAWQSLFIFIGPVGLAMLIGYYLDNGWADSKLRTIISLAVAFVISWVIIFYRYSGFRRLAKQIKADSVSNSNHKQ